MKGVEREREGMFQLLELFTALQQPSSNRICPETVFSNKSICLESEFHKYSFQQQDLSETVFSNILSSNRICPETVFSNIYKAKASAR